jgi:parallel beta-helix repeat protein
VANGIVKNNIASAVAFTAIEAGGVVTGNYASGSRGGIVVSAGSTVIGNTANSNLVGLSVTCPSNVTNNTATENVQQNLLLLGTGCKNTNNVAP